MLTDRRNVAPRDTSSRGLTSPFKPPSWLTSPHLQTIGPAVPIFSPRDYAESEELRIAISGGALHARAWWAVGRAPAVVVLHGIGGTKDSHCCIRAAVALHRAGYHAVRLDMRAAGDSVVDAPSLYHAGLTSDLDHTVRHVARDPRVTGVFVLGFSGGGSQALKLAGEWGSNVPAGVRAIASISAPLDYTRVAGRMDSLACLPYRFHVLRGLVQRARAFAERHPQRAHYTPADLESIKRFRQFDGSVIVPMHGFPDVDTYYGEASAGRLLPSIEVPSLILHAEDDPMVPIATVRPWLSGASPAVHSEVSRHGGHLGWLGGFDEASWITSWSTSTAMAFFRKHLSN